MIASRTSSIISTDSSLDAAAAVAPPTSIPPRSSLIDWSKYYASEELSHEEYIKGAVHVASMVADRFARAVNAAQNDNSLTSTEEGTPPVHFTADNVYVVLDHAGSISVELQIKPSSCAPDERAVCASLGNILLVLFSGGQASPCSDESALLPSAAKRMKTAHAAAAAAAAGSSSKLTSAAKAKALLSNLNMPNSICRLVCDLLDSQTEGTSLTFTTAITTLQEAIYDMNQMKLHPKSFLFDRTSAESALQDTALFSNSEGQTTLFGREGEIDVLLKAKRRIERHTRTQSEVASARSEVDSSGFQSEAIFLSGYAG